MLWGGRGTADKCHWCVWGTFTVFWPHWVCPCSWCVLSPSTLLRLQAALQGSGPGLCALLRLKRLRFRCSSTPQRLRFGWGCVLCLPCLSSSGSRELDELPLPGCSAPYPLRSPILSFQAHQFGTPCVCSGNLISGCDPPGGRQPSRISGSLWLEAGSLFAVW